MDVQSWLKLGIDLVLAAAVVFLGFQVRWATMQVVREIKSGPAPHSSGTQVPAPVVPRSESDTESEEEGAEIYGPTLPPAPFTTSHHARSVEDSETKSEERDEDTVRVIAFDNTGAPVLLRNGVSRHVLLNAVGMTSTGDANPAQSVVVQLMAEIRAVAAFADPDSPMERGDVARLLEGYANRLELVDELADPAQYSRG